MIASMGARRLLPILLTLSVLPGAAFAQTPRFSSRVEAVRVDVLVTTEGKPVRGLGAADFDILDNGVAQHVDLVSFEQTPLNVVLALDMSASVAGDRLSHLRAASLELVDGLKAGDRAAVVTFSQRVLIRSNLTGDRARVRRSIEVPDPMGATSLVDGTFTAMLMGKSDEGRALVIVFSDGMDTASWLSPLSVLESARRADAVVYGVSVGTGTRPAFLRDITNQTGGRLFEIESTQQLSAVFLEVLEEFRQRYVLSYSPRGVPRTGWHRLTVHVKRRGALVKARPGYDAGR